MLSTKLTLSFRRSITTCPVEVWRHSALPACCSLASCLMLVLLARSCWCKQISSSSLPSEPTPVNKHKQWHRLLLMVTQPAILCTYFITWHCLQNVDGCIVTGWVPVCFGVYSEQNYDQTIWQWGDFVYSSFKCYLLGLLNCTSCLFRSHTRIHCSWHIHVTAHYFRRFTWKKQRKKPCCTCRHFHCDGENVTPFPHVPLVSRLHEECKE